MKLATTRGGLVKLSIQMTPELLDLIDQRAEEDGMSRSAKVTELARLGLPVHDQNKRIVRAALNREQVAVG